MADSNCYVWSFIMVLALTVSEGARAVIDCPSTQQQLFPCVPFLLNIQPTPSLQCCGGVQNVANIANVSKENFRGVCECLKAAARSYPSINFGNAQRIPILCHVPLNITIDPNIDCNRL